jgi:hypothetical protein
MGAGSVLTDEHFMVCFCAEKQKISTLPVTFLLVFMFQLSNCLASFKENCFEFFTFGKYPNIWRNLLFWVVRQREVVTSYGRFGTSHRSPFVYQKPKMFAIIESLFIPKLR